MIPGGIGSFDLVFLWGAQSLGILDEKVLVLLILYQDKLFFTSISICGYSIRKRILGKVESLVGIIYPTSIDQKTSHTIVNRFNIYVRNYIAAFSSCSRYFKSLENSSGIFILTNHKCIPSINRRGWIYSIGVMQRD